MRKRVTEKKIVDVLVNYFSSSYTVKREVEHYQKSIDLIMYNGSNRITAIEAKVEDWQRSVSQAIVNLTVCDYSYIAIHKKYIHRVSLSRVRKNGLGLISVGSNWGDVKIIEKAPRSKYKNAITHEKLKKSLTFANKS